eukprot:SAG22_NODE_529_length_9428_cov_2.691178_11_plen_190_part_01
MFSSVEAAFALAAAHAAGPPPPLAPPTRFASISEVRGWTRSGVQQRASPDRGFPAACLRSAASHTGGCSPPWVSALTLTHTLSLTGALCLSLAHARALALALPLGARPQVGDPTEQLAALAADCAPADGGGGADDAGGGGGGGPAAATPTLRLLGVVKDRMDVGTPRGRARGRAGADRPLLSRRAVPQLT